MAACTTSFLSGPPSSQPSSKPSSAPLCTAILAGLFPQVRHLLLAGRSPTEVEPGPQRRCPLILAALVRDSRWAESLAHVLLEHGASVAQSDRHGLNALHYACLYGRETLVPILLAAAGDSDLNAPDRHGNCALLYAAASGSLSVLCCLCNALTRYGFSVDQPNRLGLTPLMQAWRCRHSELAKHLLASGADPKRHDCCGRNADSYRTEAIAESEWRRGRESVRKTAMRLRVDDSERWRLLRAKSAPPPAAFRGPLWRHLDAERRLCASVVTRQKKEEIDTSAAAFRLNATTFRLAAANSITLSATQMIREPRPAALTDEDSWRREVARLYGHLTTQSTPSFRRPAVEAPPEVSEVTPGEPIEPPLPLDPVPVMTRSRRGSVMSTVPNSTGRRPSRPRKPSMARSSMGSVMEDWDNGTSSTGERRSAHRRRKSNAAEDSGH